MSQDRVQATDNDRVQDIKSTSTTHKMSIALVIGATIGLIGLVIMLYGLFGQADFRRSDGINIDLWWGLLMLVFGIVMAGGNYLLARRREAKAH